MNFLCEQFSRLSTPRSAPVNYHGLMNQGATCYLNSVLQVLFMTRDFREAVERSMSRDPERIDHQLKDLFDDLKSYTAYTYKITKKLGIDRVNEQQDAVEYFEKILALTSEEASQIFHGELTHKTSCSTCCTTKSTNGTFSHLPLELVKSNSPIYCVVDGIEEYFRDLYFSGENQMYCDKCYNKSNATTKYALKDPPEVLTLLLKRFEFHYFYMCYIKNNCVVDVPCSLHIPESHMYELYAVVDHWGDLRSGHYTATVKSQDDERWYNFNDTSVTLCDQEPFQADNSNKSCSAYLLFYRKKKTPTADTSQDIRGDFLPAVGNNDDQCQDGGKKIKIEDDEEPVKVGKERCEDRSDVDDQDTCAKKHEIDERKITYDGDEEEGFTGAGEQAGKRGAFTETQPEESREDQDSRHPGEDRVRLNKPQEGLEAEATHKASDNEQMCEQDVMHGGQGYRQQVHMNMPRNEERKVRQKDKDKTGKSESEQTDKERKTLTKHPKRDEKDEFNEGVDIKDDKQEVREEHDSPYVSVNKKRGEEEMEINKRDDKRGKTSTDRPTSGRGEFMMRSDHYSHGFQIHGEHSASKDDQGCKQRSSSSRSHKTHESQEEEGRRRRKGDMGQMDRKAGNDESLLKRSKSESGRQHSDQKNVAAVRSNRSEQNVSVRRNKSLSLEKQVTEEKRTGDDVQVKPDTSFRQVRSGGSRRLTENQRVDSVERTRAEDFQSKARAEDGNVRGVKERDRSSEDDTKRQVNTGGGSERKSVALPEGFENISLKDLPTPQDHRSRKTEHVKEKRKITVGCPFFGKKGKNTFKGSEGVYNTLTSACRTRHINPLGKKCLVKCTLDGVAVEALWDTGAQRTIINETWRAKHLPRTVLKPLTDLSNTGKINLVTATGTPVSIIGWLNIELKLYKGEKETETLTVPTVVANDSCAAVRPIIGFNVIEKSKDAKPWEPEG